MICRVLFLFISAVSSLGISEEQYNRFPRLYHLDDYQRCLGERDGLYCIGTFDLSAPENNTNFQLMKAHSEFGFKFNRTRIHRGYCVSERCPFEENAKLRFERCVAKRALRYSLTTNLSKAECTTYDMHQEKNNVPPDATQRIFIYVIYVLLVMNVLGTVCDAYSKPGDDKWRLLKCWSVPSNWSRLVDTTDTTYTSVKPLAVIQGIRTGAVFMVIGVHGLVGRLMMYIYHPHRIEQMFHSLWVQTILSGMSVLQVFVMITSFLTTYIIIVMSDKYELSIRMLPLVIFKRVARVSPTNMFMVGFAATWWYRLGDGPLWSSIVGLERSNCQKNFWAHAFYVNNLVDVGSGYCMTPIWFLTADFYANVVVSVLALIMAKWGRKALFINAVLWIITCVINTTVAYMNSWKPIIYTTSPDKLRVVYVGTDEQNAFRYLHMSTWNMLPGCFLGMFCAYLLKEFQKVGFRPAGHKWLKKLYNITILLLCLWLLIGYYVNKYNTYSIVAALHVAIHGPVFCIIVSLLLLFSPHFTDTIQTKILAMKFWHIPSRLSLPVLIIHWIGLTTMAARTQHAMSIGTFDVFTDWIVLLVGSYSIAFPVAVFLEIPARRFLETLMFNQKLKTN